MASTEALLRGHGEHSQFGTKVYVIQFPNPFDESNEDLNDTMTIREARKQFFRIFKTSRRIQKPIFPVEQELQELNENLKKLRDLEKAMNEAAVPKPVKEKVVWAFGQESDTETISKRNFLMAVISSVLFTVRYELNLSYTLLESRDKDEVFCEIYAREDWLEKKAQNIGYRLQFRAEREDLENLAKYPFKEVPPYAQFEIPSNNPDARDIFKHFDEDEIEIANGGSFFTYTDRIRLVRNSLNTKLDLHIMKEYDISIEDFCIHSEKPLQVLKESWANFGSLLEAQPIDKIRSYFGEKVALYFAWMEYYKSFMVYAGIVGLIVQIFVFTDNLLDEKDKDAIKGLSYKQISQILFAVFLSFWISTFDQLWTRKEKEYAWKWGITNFYEEEEQRGQFKGRMRRDPVSNKMRRERLNETWHRIRTFISYSVVLVFMFCSIILVTSILFLRYILLLSNDTTTGYILSGVLNAIQIRIMNLVYDKVAVLLNDWENYETETLYNNHLAAKVFVFRFVNSYSSLFYLAYFANYPDSCADGSCMDALTIQVAVIYLISLLLNFVEILFPWLLFKRRVISENMKVAEMRKVRPEIREHLYPIEKESKYESYESPLDDYIEMIIELGYVALFGTALPILPLLLLLEIILEIRVDAWKICNVTKRADPHRSEDIGVFKSIVVALAYVGAANNSGLIVYTSGLMGNFIKSKDDWYLYVLAFIALEHVLVLGMFLISVLIPDDPEVVEKGLVWSDRIINERLYLLGGTAKEQIERHKADIVEDDSGFMINESKFSYTQ